MHAATLLLALSNFAAAYLIYDDNVRAKGVLDPGTTSACTYFLKIDGPLDTCEAIEAYYQIQPAEFRTIWNPSIGPACQSGALVIGHSYCVSTDQGFPKPRQPGIIGQCTRYYWVRSGDTCTSIVNGYFNTFTLADFYSWNTQTGVDCNALYANEWACVGIS